jgi:hypothetical protein
MDGIDPEQAGDYHGKYQNDLLRQTERSKREGRQETPPIYDPHMSAHLILHNISGSRLGTNNGDVDHTINHYGAATFPRKAPFNAGLLTIFSAWWGLLRMPSNPHRTSAHDRSLRLSKAKTPMQLTADELSRKITRLEVMMER